MLSASGRIAVSTAAIRRRPRRAGQSPGDFGQPFVERGAKAVFERLLDLRACGRRAAAARFDLRRGRCGGGSAEPHGAKQFSGRLSAAVLTASWDWLARSTFRASPFVRA